MDRIISEEDRLKRAQEIYYRRKNQTGKNIYINSVDPFQKKKKRLIKRIIIQLCICLAICTIIGSKKFVNNEFKCKITEILNYDINIRETYMKLLEYSKSKFNKLEINSEVEESKSQMDMDVDYIKSNYNFVVPVEGNITSGFGNREIIEGNKEFHQGIDISAVEGTLVYATIQGNVVAATFSEDYGNFVKIQSEDIITLYAHLSELDVKVGDVVVQNQVIGKVGNTRKFNWATFTF